MRRCAAVAKAAGATAKTAKGARPKLSMSRKPPTLVVSVSDQTAEQNANALAATSTRWVKPRRIGGRSRLGPIRNTSAATPSAMRMRSSPTGTPRWLQRPEKTESATARLIGHAASTTHARYAAATSAASTTSATSACPTGLCRRPQLRAPAAPVAGLAPRRQRQPDDDPRDAAGHGVLPELVAAVARRRRRRHD